MPAFQDYEAVAGRLTAQNMRAEIQIEQLAAQNQELQQRVAELEAENEDLRVAAKEAARENIAVARPNGSADSASH